MKVLGIVGSLRAGSYNRGLMRAAVELGKNAGLEIEIFERLGELPPYNVDIDTDELRPEPVTAFKSAMSAARGILIASPEYNYSVPGVLKNAIDWASRPVGRSPLTRKAAAIMGAAQGMGGTIRAQLALRQIFVFSDTFALLQPEVLIPNCAARFDADVNLTDESTRALVERQMKKFAIWIDAIDAAAQTGATAPA